MFRKTMFSALALAVTGFAPAAQAIPLGFSYNAGPLIAAVNLDPFSFSFDPLAPPEAFAFDPGEDVFVDVVIDSAATQVVVSLDNVRYQDPFGTITLFGADSGALWNLAPGVDLELSNDNEFDVVSLIPGFGELVFALDGYLVDDTDFRSRTPFLTDIFDLTTSVAEIDAAFPGGVTSLDNLSAPSTGVIAYADLIEGAPQGAPLLVDEGVAFFFALEFGPVPNAVPLPATLPLMLAGLGGAALLRRRRGSRSKSD